MVMALKFTDSTGISYNRVIHAMIHMAPNNVDINKMANCVYRHRDYLADLIEIWQRAVIDALSNRQRVSLIYMADIVIHKPLMRRFNHFKPSFAKAVDEVIEFLCNNVREISVLRDIREVMWKWQSCNIFEKSWMKHCITILENSIQIQELEERLHGITVTLHERINPILQNNNIGRLPIAIAVDKERSVTEFLTAATRTDAEALHANDIEEPPAVVLNGTDATSNANEASSLLVDVDVDELSTAVLCNTDITRDAKKVEEPPAATLNSLYVTNNVPKIEEQVSMSIVTTKPDTNSTFCIDVAKQVVVINGQVSSNSNRVAKILSNVIAKTENELDPNAANSVRFVELGEIHKTAVVEAQLSCGITTAASCADDSDNSAKPGVTD